MTQISIAAITERLQASALDVEQWQGSLDEITRCLGVAGVMMLCDEPAFDRPINSRTIEDASRDYIRNGWFRRDERAQGIPTLLARGLMSDDDFSTAREREASAYYQEFLRPHGLGLFACVGFRAGEALWGMSFLRHAGEPAFSSRQLQLLHKLRRPLADAAALSRQVSFARVLGATDAYEHMRQPAVALGSDLRILAFNDRAAALCGRVFDTHQGRLRFIDGRTDVAFATLVRRQRSEGVAAALQGSDNRSGTVPLRLIELAGWSRLAFSNARYLLLIGAADMDADQAMTTLRERFALTPAEARVAFALQSGQSLSVIATTTGIGYETVRKHLRAVFAKMGVSRQAELAIAVKDALTF